MKQIVESCVSALVIVVGAFVVVDMDFGAPGIIVLGLVVLYIGWRMGWSDGKRLIGKERKDDE